MAKRRSVKFSSKSKGKVVRHMAASRSFNAMPPKVFANRIGHWAFLIGFLVAILASFFTNSVSPEFLISVLFGLGVIVGLLNVTLEETSRFLIAAIALILSGVVNLGLIPLIGMWLKSVLSNMVIFVVPAAVIVALRTVWILANRE